MAKDWAFSEAKHVLLTRDAPFARIICNAAWLGSGQIAGDVCAVAYLMVLSTALGIERFNALILILAIGQGVSHVCGFQSWRFIVRYGRQTSRSNFFAMCRWVAARDLAVGGIGGAICAVAIALFSSHLGLPDDLHGTAMLFSLSLLASQRGIPCGLLRLAQHFSVCAMLDMLLPILRLLVAAATIVFDLGINGVLTGWVISEGVITGLYWLAALSHRPTLPPSDMTSSDAIDTEKAKSRFYWLSGSSEALRLCAPDLLLLAIAWNGGTSALGAFRLITAVAKAASKPASTLAIAFYTEALHSRVAANARKLKATFQLTGIATLVLTLCSFCLCSLTSAPAFASQGVAATIGIGGTALIGSFTAILEARLLVNQAPAIVPLGRIMNLAFTLALPVLLAAQDKGPAAAIGALIAGALHSLLLLAQFKFKQPSLRPFPDEMSAEPQLVIRITGRQLHAPLA